MSLDNLLSDENERARLFPVTRRWAFLAHAAVAPLPTPVSAAIADFAHRVSLEGQFDQALGNSETEVRELAAHLLHALPTEIAIVPSTSAGISIIAEGLSWQDRDNVVIEEHGFPANTYPWLELDRLGVRVRLVPWETRPLTIDTIRPFLDEQTRLVALSSAHFVSGRPIENIAEIGRELRRHRILCCVDAIQTLGARSFEAHNVDFVVADGHKWLLAAKGCGILYVRQAVMDLLRPALVGWHSVAKPWEYNSRQRLSDSARRYEPGSLNELGIVGLQAALTLLTNIGYDTIEARVRALRQYLLAGLRQCAAILVDSPDENHWSGIVSFRLAKERATDTVQRLRLKGVLVSSRQLPDGTPVVRVSPHFYNTESELARLLELL